MSDSKQAPKSSSARHDSQSPVAIVKVNQGDLSQIFNTLNAITSHFDTLETTLTKRIDQIEKDIAKGLDYVTDPANDTLHSFLDSATQVNTNTSASLKTFTANPLHCSHLSFFRQ